MHHFTIDTAVRCFILLNGKHIKYPIVMLMLLIIVCAHAQHLADELNPIKQFKCAL